MSTQTPSTKSGPESSSPTKSRFRFERRLLAPPHGVPLHVLEAACTPIEPEAQAAWTAFADSHMDAILAFLEPQLWADLDWSRGWEAIDGGGLLRVEPNSKPSAIETLFRLHCRDGDEHPFLFHLEARGSVLRLMGEHVVNLLGPPQRKPVLPIDRDGERPRLVWRPGGRDNFGLRVTACYKTVDLDRYNASWKKLEGAGNPCALVIMAHLKRIATRRNMPQRLRWKLRLAHRLGESIYPQVTKTVLRQTLDDMLRLPRTLQQHFEQQHSEQQEGQSIG